MHEMDPLNPDLGAAATDVEPIAVEVPDAYSLEQNYPNPFNPQTTIRFGMKDSGKVRLVVVDMLGRLVTTLVDTQMAAGTHEVVFDAGDLPSGSYLYRLETESTTVTRILSLLK